LHREHQPHDKTGQPDQRLWVTRSTISHKFSNSSFIFVRAKLQKALPGIFGSLGSSHSFILWAY
jgi:hypothetical protein